MPPGDHLIRTDEIGLTVALVGSRSFPFEMFPDRAVNEIGTAIDAAGFPIAEIISGGAEGVDSAGVEWARQVGLSDGQIIERLPDWDKHGKQAGFKRNSTIVEDADAIVALWNGKSSGTADTLGKARYDLGDDRIHIHGIGGRAPSIQDINRRSL